MEFILSSGRKSYTTEDDVTGQLNIRSFGMSYDSEVEYLAGAVVEKDLAFYKANDAIPAGTAFLEGSSGATWTAIAGAGGGIEIFDPTLEYETDSIVIHNNAIFKAKTFIPETRGFGSDIGNGGMDSDWQLIHVSTIDKEVHVSAGADSEAANGTLEFPYPTILHAVEKHNWTAGSTMVVHPGVYDEVNYENPSADVFREGMVIDFAEAGHYFNIRSFGGKGTVILGNGVRDVMFTESSGTVPAVDYLIIEDLVFRGKTHISPFSVTNGSIENCYFEKGLISNGWNISNIKAGVNADSDDESNISSGIVTNSEFSQVEFRNCKTVRNIIAVNGKFTVRDQIDGIHYLTNSEFKNLTLSREEVPFVTTGYAYLDGVRTTYYLTVHSNVRYHFKNVFYVTALSNIQGQTYSMGSSTIQFDESLKLSNFNAPLDDRNVSFLVTDSDDNVKIIPKQTLFAGFENQWIHVSKDANVITADGTQANPFPSFADAVTAFVNGTIDESNGSKVGFMIWPGDYSAESIGTIQFSIPGRAINFQAAIKGTATLPYFGWETPTTDSYTAPSDSKIYFDGLNFAGGGFTTGFSDTAMVPVFTNCEFNNFTFAAAPTFPVNGLFKDSVARVDASMSLGSSTGLMTFQNVIFEGDPSSVVSVGKINEFRNCEFYISLSFGTSVFATGSYYAYYTRMYDCTFNGNLEVTDARQLVVNDSKARGFMQINVNAELLASGFTYYTDMAVINGRLTSANFAHATVMSKAQLTNPSGLGNTSVFATIDSDGYLGKGDSRILAWNQGKSYKAGEIVENSGAWFKANGNIPSGTTWTEGSAGATWSPVGSYQSLITEYSSGNFSAFSTAAGGTHTPVIISGTSGISLSGNTFTILSAGVYKLFADIPQRSTYAGHQWYVNGSPVGNESVSASANSTDSAVPCSSTAFMELSEGDQVEIRSTGSAGASSSYESYGSWAIEKIAGLVPSIGVRNQFIFAKIVANDPVVPGTAINTFQAENSKGLSLTAGKTVRLSAGVTYNLEAEMSISSAADGSTANRMEYRWRNVTDNAYFGATGGNTSGGLDYTASIQGTAKAIITPSKDIDVELWVTVEAAGAAVIPDQESWMSITAIDNQPVIAEEMIQTQVTVVEDNFSNAFYGSNAVIKFDTVKTKVGQIDYDAVSGTFTVPTDGTYELYAAPFFDNFTSYATFLWEKTDGTVLSHEGAQQSINRSANEGVSPVVSTIVDLEAGDTIRLRTDSIGETSVRLRSGFVNAYVKMLSKFVDEKPKASMANYVTVGYDAAGAALVTSMTAGDVIAPNIIKSSKGIKYDTTTGEFYLKAGVTYELEADIQIRAGYTQFEWKDASGNVIGIGGGCYSNVGTDDGDSSPAYAIFTPGTDTTVKLEVTGNTGFNAVAWWAFGKMMVKAIANQPTYDDSALTETSYVLFDGINKSLGAWAAGSTNTSVAATSGFTVLSSSNPKATSLGNGDILLKGGYTYRIRTSAEITGGSTANSRLVIYNVTDDMVPPQDPMSAISVNFSSVASRSSEGFLYYKAEYDTVIRPVQEYQSAAAAHKIIMDIQVVGKRTPVDMSDYKPIVGGSSSFNDQREIVNGNLRVRSRSDGAQGFEYSSVSSSMNVCITSSTIFTNTATVGALFGASFGTQKEQNRVVNPGSWYELYNGTWGSHGSSVESTIWDQNTGEMWKVTCMIGSAYVNSPISIQKLI